MKFSIFNDLVAIIGRADTEIGHLLSTAEARHTETHNKNLSLENELVEEKRRSNQLDQQLTQLKAVNDFLGATNRQIEKEAKTAIAAAADAGKELERAKATIKANEALVDETRSELKKAKDTLSALHALLSRNDIRRLQKNIDGLAILQAYLSQD